MTNILGSPKVSSPKVKENAESPQQQLLRANTSLGSQNKMKIPKREPVMANTLGSQRSAIEENEQQQPIIAGTSGSNADNEREQLLMAKPLSYQLSVYDENGQYERALEPMYIRLEELFQRLQRESLYRCCLCGTATYKKDRLEHIYMCCLQINGGLYNLRCNICNIFRCVYKPQLTTHQKSCTAVKFLPLRVSLKNILKGGKEEPFVTGMIASIEAKAPNEILALAKIKVDRKMKNANKDKRSENKTYIRFANLK